MSNEIDKRIRGTMWQSIYLEFLRNSIYFPLANIMVEMILEGPAEVIGSADFFGSLAAASLQAWFLGYRQYKGRPLPLVGNLIGPALYTLLEIITTSGVFIHVPFHVVYWVSAFIIGFLQHLRLSASGRFSALLLLSESVARSSILVFMFWFIVRIVSPEFNQFEQFMLDKPHVFIVITILFLAMISGLSDIRAERFLSMLRETAEQLQQYSHWLLGRDMLSLAIADQQALTLTRRERTVMFMDIRGFTEWSENQQPEVVVAMLNHYYESSETVLSRRGVIQLKFTADEIMAFFASSDEAIQAAFALHDITGSILDEYGLKVGTGLHVGPVVEGLLGSSELKRYDIIGDTVNTAKRICSAADSGELLVSRELFLKTEGLCRLIELREITAKGKSAPLDVCLVRPHSV